MGLIDRQNKKKYIGPCPYAYNGIERPVMSHF